MHTKYVDRQTVVFSFPTVQNFYFTILGAVTDKRSQKQLNTGADFHMAMVATAPGEKLLMGAVL